MRFDHYNGIYSMFYLLKKMIGFLLLVATVGWVSIQALIHAFQ